VILQDIRDYIRMQLDMDEEELPNSMLDSYVDEAYNRTISMENRWPFFEARWTATKIGADPSVLLPLDCNASGLTTVIDDLSGIRLVQVSNEQAEDNVTHLTQTTNPIYYSIWGSDLALWPNPDNDRLLRLRGYRNPAEWMRGGAGAQPDCDVRLHQLLAHYSIALAYAQQEDEVLEDVYMKRWQASFSAAHNAICSPRHHRPIILNGGLPLTAFNSASMTWGPPVSP
jgi:hypothetical protein